MFFFVFWVLLEVCDFLNFYVFLRDVLEFVKIMDMFKNCSFIFILIFLKKLMQEPTHLQQSNMLEGHKDTLKSKGNQLDYSTRSRMTQKRPQGTPESDNFLMFECCMFQRTLAMFSFSELF